MHNYDPNNPKTPNSPQHHGFACCCCPQRDKTKSGRNQFSAVSPSWPIPRRWQMLSGTGRGQSKRRLFLPRNRLVPAGLQVPFSQEGCWQTLNFMKTKHKPFNMEQFGARVYHTYTGGPITVGIPLLQGKTWEEEKSKAMRNVQTVFRREINCDTTNNPTWWHRYSHTLHTLQVSHYFSLFGQLNLPVNPTLDQQPNKQTNNQIF